MSGGLEVAAGVIAVVQVTGQAVVLTLKIKQLWAEVRNAPQEVQDLLDEIELTSLLLQDIERQTEQRGMPVGLASASIMQHTQRAHQALESTADLLDAELKRSPSRVRIMMASTKVLLKKSMLDQLKEKMDRSLRLLQMSLQVQTVMLVARASSITLDPLQNAPSESLPAITSADGNTLANEAAEDMSKQSQVTHSKTASKSCLHSFDPRQVHQWSWAGRFNFNFSSGDEGWISVQLPSWLSRSTHLLITNKALGGPQMVLRRYDVIEQWDAQVFDALHRDDWPSLERNLRTTRISPFATSVHGGDLVIFACIYKSIKILKRLLDIGLEAQVDSSDDDDDEVFRPNSRNL
ncbi:hypothetical protein F5X68DRAFT_234155 [Plectosphaerella plurivora]|uniref:Fungal N-terminal domain-containing protein n=1 Tax=Plectosphaerella plurivora TaxID=936078 RepID=A0A9P8V742_9PEZI|nr:hypothetical protein F5X68DRAFT_234155 [Plectosphaerella plurivora]